MALWLKQNTGVTIKLGPFLDDADGKTAETSLSIDQADVRLSKNGGNIAQKNESSSASHDELGYYDVALDGTDTGTLGTLRVAVSESGALPVWQDFLVLPANVYDALVSGSDKLQVDAVEVSGDSGAADNLETAFDGGSYNVGGGSIVAASVSGAVGSVGAGGITASTLAANTLTAAKVDSDVGTEFAAAVWNALILDHNEDNSFGARLQPSFTTILSTGSTTTALVLNSAPSADQFVDHYILIAGGTNARGEVRRITDITGSTVTVTPALSAIPNNGAAVVILPDRYEAGGGSGATAEEVWEYSDRSLTDKDGFSLSGTTQADVTSIKGKTDNLPTDPADQSAVEAAITAATSGLATASALTTVGTNVSTVLSRLGAFTGSGVNTVLGFFKALLSSAASTPSDVGGTFSAATDSVEAIRDRGDAAWTSGGGGGSETTLRTGTAQAGAATTITLDSGASSVDDYYNFAIVAITGGTGAGQAKIASDYVGSTKVLTVNGTWATTPDNTSEFVLLPFGAVPGASAPTVAEIWAYANRTLTQSAVQVTSAVSGSTITVTRGDTLSITLTGLGSLAGNTKLWFGVKASTYDADTAALLMVERTTGLVRIAGAAGTAEHASITVNDEGSGSITIALNAVPSALLANGSHTYEVQMKHETTGITTKSRGTFVVTGDVVRATS